MAVHTIVSGDFKSRLMCRIHIVTASEKVGVKAGGGHIIKSLRNFPADEMTK